MAVCCGFSSSGLPLGVQLAGRPFDDAMVLRVAHAYELATSWHARRPVLSSETECPAVPQASAPGAPSRTDSRVRQIAAAAVEQAGFTPDGQRFEEICEAAPYVLAIAQRLRGPRRRSNEPSGVFAIAAARP